MKSRPFKGRLFTVNRQSMDDQRSTKPLTPRQRRSIRMNDSPRPVIGFIYDLILGAASGFALGFFAWLASDRITDTSQPFWPWAVGGVVVLFFVVRWARQNRGTRRWVHLLWIPVLAFVALMTMVILALRAWGS